MRSALLEVRVERHKRALEHHVGERDERQGLRDDHAAEAVELPVEVEHPGDQTISAEKDDERQGEQYGGRSTGPAR